MLIAFETQFALVYKCVNLQVFLQRLISLFHGCSVRIKRIISLGVGNAYSNVFYKVNELYVSQQDLVNNLVNNHHKIINN
jgi:hypothetical protein